MQSSLSVAVTVALDLALLAGTANAQNATQPAPPATAPRVPAPTSPPAPAQAPGATPAVPTASGTQATPPALAPAAPGAAPPTQSVPTPGVVDPTLPAATPQAAPSPAPQPPTAGQAGPMQFETVPPPVPAPDPTAHRHDGFYLRLGLGAGFLSGSVAAPMGDLGVQGGIALFDIALGGTVAEGLVIGGALFAGGGGKVRWSGDSLRDLPTSDGSDELTGKEVSLGFLGVLIDYYPNARGGFHVLGGLGLASLGFERNAQGDLPPEPWEGGGGGVVLGVGYEAWIADQWSLGGVARVLLMSGTLRGADSDVDLDARAIAPGLLFSATHH